MNDMYADAALKYVPKRGTRVLFIAEAPPNSIERYFYFENVQSFDWLWMALMKALYPCVWSHIANERKQKPSWLAKFQEDGFQLIDALKTPVSGNASKRVGEIEKHAANLIEETQAISPIQIVLIKKTVHDALFEELKVAGLPVINSSAIPFPSSGRQNQFHKDLSELKLSRKIFQRNDQ
jgi:hypothetical protein